MLLIARPTYLDVEAMFSRADDALRRTQVDHHPITYGQGDVQGTMADVDAVIREMLNAKRALKQRKAEREAVSGKQLVRIAT